jgi:hypothetical protein
LKDRRATLAREIVQFKQGIVDCEEQPSHIDATLRILAPAYRADTIPSKRLRRVKLFGNGVATVNVLNGSSDPLALISKTPQRPNGNLSGFAVVLNNILRYLNRGGN